VTKPEAETEETLAKQLAAEFSGQPLLEFGVWLLLAQRREAALLQAHETALAACRDPDGDAAAPTATYALVTRALGLVSRHEASHGQLLDRWKAALQEGSSAAGFFGRLEGWVMLSSMSGKVAPALTQWLKAMMTGQHPVAGAAGGGTRSVLIALAADWAELELAAAEGYARMLALLSATPLDSIEAQFGVQFASMVPAMLELELPRLLAEERFHAALLARVQTWCLPDRNATLPGLEALEVLGDIHALGEQYLRLERVEGLRREVSEAVSKDDAGIWIGDAGIGALFARHTSRPRLL